MKKTIFLFLATLLLTACSKDSTSETPADTLPPATTSGANTAGCYINGKLLIPKNADQQIGGPAIYGLKIGSGINFNAPIIGDDYFYVKIANLKDTASNDIYIHFNDMQMGTGNYIVGQSNGNYYTAAPSNNQIIAHTYDGNNLSKTYWSAPNSGTITVTRFDYTNGIYSGTFSCTLYNKDNTSETIQVTDGRFDINVATLNQ